MKSTFGVIVGNRAFFSDELAQQGAKDVKRVLKENGCNVVSLTTKDTKFGTVETREDAKKCAELFKHHADRIDGVIVTLPNFGDERGVAETLRLAGLDVPVLVQATPDEVTLMKMG